MANNAHEPRAVFAFRLPQSMLDALDAYAYSQDISREKAARRLIAAGLDIEYNETHGNTKYATPEAKKIASARASRRYRIIHD